LDRLAFRENLIYDAHEGRFLALLRRLAAILAADVVDYSRLMGEDQLRTLAALRQLRAALFEPVVNDHRGNIVKRMGDGWIVEFASVSDAVDCALYVQNGLIGHEIIRLRVGIHIGDVVFEEDDVFGDGVNVAARLEELAEPGEVLISDTAHHSLDQKTSAAFHGGDARKLKNIARPVAVWRWSIDGPTDNIALRSDETPIFRKPSIAVLPFDNMSDDPDQEYFSDGIAEDIITDLSRFSWLTVIARNSSFSFKGQAMDLRAVAMELGVRYVLEGSVRKAGTKVRITAQLIDANDGSHIWAERYSRELEDIFDLQDEMTQAITTAIGPELENFEIRRALGKRPDNLDAWDYVMRARSVIQSLTRQCMLEGRRLVELALEIQPGYPEALAAVAMISVLEAMSGWSKNAAASAEKAIEAAQQALKGNPNDTVALSARGYGEGILGQQDRAVETLRQCVRLNPNENLPHQALATVLTWRGDYPEAVREAEQAIKLAPRGINTSYTYFVLATAHFANGNAAEAVNWCEKVMQEFPSFPISHIYAAACVEMGDLDKAQKAIADLLAVAPQVTIKLFQNMVPAKGGSFLARYAAALRIAGLPEG
jgi:TolB-like protein